jgi:hypothetical protein
LIDGRQVLRESGDEWRGKTLPAGLNLAACFLFGVCVEVCLWAGAVSRGPSVCDGGVCTSIGDPFILNSSSREYIGDIFTFVLDSTSLNFGATLPRHSLPLARIVASAIAHTLVDEGRARRMVLVVRKKVCVRVCGL